MAYQGDNFEQTNRTVQKGEPMEHLSGIVETATSLIPGALVATGTAEGQLVVATPILKPIGVVSYEDTVAKYKVDHTITTAFTADDKISFVSGGGFEFRGKVALGFNGVRGDPVINWDLGMVAVCQSAGDGHATLKIPWTGTGDETDTGINLPADVLVTNAWYEVTSAGGTLNCGILSSEANGSSVGFIIAAVTTSAFKNQPSGTITDGAIESYLSVVYKGAFLSGSSLGSNVANNHGILFEEGYRTDGTATSISYDASAGAGFIYLEIYHESIMKVGNLQGTATGLSAAVEATIRAAF